MHRNTHTNWTNTQNPAGKTGWKRGPQDWREKKAVVFFFYDVSGWSTQPEGRQHTHKYRDGGDSDQIELEGNLCGDCPVLQTSNTHTHTHTSNSSNWRCHQLICTHLSQLLQQTQTFSLEWALWHGSKCLNTACHCVCLCMHVWGFTNVVQKNMESSDWFSDPRIGSFPFSDWLLTTVSTQRRQKTKLHLTTSSRGLIKSATGTHMKFSGYSLRAISMMLRASW